MDREAKVKLLFCIASEVERSFEMPVILLTMKDYAADAIDALVQLNVLLGESACAERVLKVVSAFHFGWLQAVQEAEDFKCRARFTPRSHALEALTFTVENVKKRETNFRNFIKTNNSPLTSKENELMQDNLKCIGDMNENLIAALKDKYTSFVSAADQTEYYHRVLDEAEEFLTWIDMLHDNLSIQVSSVLDISCPKMTSELADTLQEIIDRFAAKTGQQDLVKDLKNKSENLNVILNLPKHAEAKKILQKIKILNHRIEKLKNQNSSAVLALEHKAMYLQQRIQSMENLKTSLYKLTEKKESTSQVIRFFNHLLPRNDRGDLVKSLLKLWTDAICKNLDRTTVVSIVSQSNSRKSREQLYSDKIGTYFIDYYGRKLYINKAGDKFQLDYKNDLVPLTDDNEHFYFYDDLGRYYLNDKMERIYKFDKNSSAYCLHQGRLYMVEDFQDGKQYWYDNLGRYYIDELGKRVYSDNGVELYEDDGFNNLVRIRSMQPVYDAYSKRAGPLCLEENLYLQRAVGAALKKCIARVVLQQPADPVRCLAACLEECGRREQRGGGL